MPFQGTADLRVCVRAQTGTNIYDTNYFTETTSGYTVTLTAKKAIKGYCGIGTGTLTGTATKSQVTQKATYLDTIFEIEAAVGQTLILNGADSWYGIWVIC